MILLKFFILFFSILIHFFTERGYAFSEEVQFFTSKSIVASNQYQKIVHKFSNRIRGKKDEIIYQLRKIDFAGKSYYKVFYKKNNYIDKYYFFKGGVLISYTKYLYHKRNNLKLTAIQYYNSSSKLIMVEKMIYDPKFYKIVKTQRYLKN